MAKRKWIAGAINPKNKGALHKELGVPQGKKIPASKLKAAAKKGGKVGRRARFAEELEGFGGKRKAGAAKKRLEQKGVTF